MILLLFIMGLVWGSFLNVVIYRVAHGKSPAQGRSRCPKCNNVIPWKYNIPLLSFIILKGRCAFCHKPISWQYPLIEFITGLMFVWWYLIGTQFFRLIGSPWFVIQPVFWLAVAMIMLVIFMTDLLYGVIPLVINMIFLSLILVYRLLLASYGLMNSTDMWRAVAAAVGVWFLFVVIQKATKMIKKVDGLGGGDLALVPGLGLLLGWPKVLIGIFFAFVIGAVVGIVLVCLGKKKMSHTVPFAPFLIFGTVIALIWGGSIWNWYVMMLQ